MATERHRRSTVTVGDVARHAGVSIGTVSNVLNRPQQVRPEILARVKKSIGELGFVRNNVARSLAGGSSRTLAFVMTDLANSLFVDVARGAEDAAQDENMRLVLANSDVRAAKQAAYLEHFDEEQVAGILLTPVGGQLDGLDAVRRHGRPVVIVDFDPRTPDSCSVSADNERAGYLAAAHLIGLGRRRLLFAGDLKESRAVADRFAGARAAVAEYGGIRLERVGTDDVRTEHGRLVGYELAERPRDQMPDGIVAAAELVALGIVQALLSRTELDIPGDVAIVACDDNRSAFESMIPISAVALPGLEMGRTATKLLVEEIRSPETHTHRRVILEPLIVARESTVGRARATGSAGPGGAAPEGR